MTADGIPPEIAQYLAASGSTTVISGNVDRAVTGGNIGTLIMGNQRDVLESMTIPVSEIQRCCATFVDHQQFADAKLILERESAVALVGPPGCGRRTTGTVLLASLTAVVHIVVLDAEDLERQLAITAGHGYLLDLDEDYGQLSAKAGVWIGRLAAQLRQAGSWLVVRAREDSWLALRLSSDAVHVTRLTPPPAIKVFTHHLAGATSGPVADAWARHEQVTRHLADMPADGARLAAIVARTDEPHLPVDQYVGPVVEEYTNWVEQLADWFGKATGQDGGYRRALLLAAAALEGAPAPTVFAAADNLAKIVGLDRQPGGALVGPDASQQIDEINAELRGRAITFARSAYADSVLDHVWTQRPQLHADLRKWLIATSSAEGEDCGLAARAITRLAIRRREASLLTEAARQWSQDDRKRRGLAIPELTEAALSEEIGPQVRRQLYNWAQRTDSDEPVLLAVAAVCEGQLARRYPQIALTRLRHLVVRPNEGVREAVYQSLITLVREPALYPSVLAEVARWVQEKEPRRSAGMQAFMRLAAPDVAGGIAILSEARQRDWGLLSELWRSALRDSEQGTRATALASAWLDGAARGPAPREPVLQILAGSCQSSIDVARMAGIAFVGADRENDPARYDIAAELVRRTWERDPLTPGRGPATGDRS